MLARVVGTATTVPIAVDLFQDAPIDLLFIRISEWDNYRKIAPLLPRPPGTIIFLSGRTEKCVRHLLSQVDFHLQPPYLRSGITAVFHRLASPTFQPRCLDVFFLRVNCRMHAIPLASLQRVQSKGGFLTIQTDTAEYVVAGNLTRFRQRLPVTFTQTGRGLLIAHPF